MYSLTHMSLSLSLSLSLIVIKGWDQGLVGRCIGEKLELTIPPELGYGSRAMGSAIPANSVLWFDVEVVGIAGVKNEL